MRIAYCIRPDYEKLMGGDVIQMLKTKEHLEKNFDVLIDIITNPDQITNEYNIVHVFNFSTYKISRVYIKKAVLLNIPVVSSPIYWDYSYASTAKLFYLFSFLKRLDEPVIHRLKKMAQVVGYVSQKPVGVSGIFKRNARQMFENSKIVAPNSAEEGDLLLKWIGIKNGADKIRVVYNATETVENGTIPTIEENEFLQKYGIPQNYILQVGRIEYCKNQINLIAALENDPGIPIVFVGKVFDHTYYKKLKRMADKRGNVFFIDAVPHSEISHFFKYARLHVLLSLRESPGLVNIEALANDCPIVTSDERFLPVKTYFYNQPYIANPLDINEVKNVILDAYSNRVIRPFDFEKFSWYTVSKQTYAIYQETLNSESSDININ